MRQYNFGNENVILKYGGGFHEDSKSNQAGSV